MLHISLPKHTKKAEKDHTSLLPSTVIRDTTSPTKYSVTPVLASAANTHHTRATQLSTMGPPLHHNSSSRHLIVRCHRIPRTSADLSLTVKQSTASPSSAANLLLSPMLDTTPWGQFSVHDTHSKQDSQLSGFCYPNNSRTLYIAYPIDPPANGTAVPLSSPFFKPTTAPPTCPDSPEVYHPILLEGLKEMKKQLDAIQITLQTCIANLQGNQPLLPSNGQPRTYSKSVEILPIALPALSLLIDFSTLGKPRHPIYPHSN